MFKDFFEKLKDSYDRALVFFERLDSFIKQNRWDDLENELYDYLNFINGKFNNKYDVDNIISKYVEKFKRDNTVKTHFFQHTVDLIVKDIHSFSNSLNIDMFVYTLCLFCAIIQVYEPDEIAYQIPEYN